MERQTNWVYSFKLKGRISINLWEWSNFDLSDWMEIHLEKVAQIGPPPYLDHLDFLEAVIDGTSNSFFSGAIWCNTTVLNELWLQLCALFKKIHVWISFKFNSDIAWVFPSFWKELTICLNQLWPPSFYQPWTTTFWFIKPISAYLKYFKKDYFGSDRHSVIWS